MRADQGQHARTGKRVNSRVPHRDSMDRAWVPPDDRSENHPHQLVGMPGDRFARDRRRPGGPIGQPPQWKRMRRSHRAARPAGRLHVGAGDSARRPIG